MEAACQQEIDNIVLTMLNCFIYAIGDTITEDKQSIEKTILLVKTLLDSISNDYVKLEDIQNYIEIKYNISIV